jgi:hypothetical protein
MVHVFPSCLRSLACVDPKFANDFMLTYPYLISTDELLREVADAYDKNVHDNASQLKYVPPVMHL